jgi:hypothetical protein
VVDFCTCGASPPADARFCHRCGRPLFEERKPEIESDSEPEVLSAAAQSAAPPPLPEEPAPISFHNANAVRAAFFTAILIWLLMIIPLGGAIGLLLKLFVLLGGGFFAVIFYSRRTGQSLTVAAGARLGWITGVLFYVIWILFFTLTILVLQEQGGLLEAYKKQLEDSNANADTVRQLTEIMQSPEVFATMIVLMLAMVFVAFTLPMILGGAAAAKALERD